MIVSGTGLNRLTKDEHLSNQAGKNKVMDKDDFLRLMISQLKAQDPLNPIDSQEYTAQLAQFSELEQVFNINSNLEKLNLYQKSLNNVLLSSLIGKDILATSNNIVFRGNAVPLNLKLEDNAKEVTVSIFNNNGQKVRDILLQEQRAGYRHITWDGRDYNGIPVEEGAYYYTVKAENGKGDDVKTTSYIRGIVEAVNFSNGNSNVVIEGNEIDSESIVKIFGD